MSTATARAYDYSAAWHPSFGVPKRRKAQKVRGFRANRTYRLCIKDNVLTDSAYGGGAFLTDTKKAGDIG